MNTLACQLGEEKVNQALAGCFNDYAGQVRLTSAVDLVSRFRRRRRAQGLISDLFASVTLYDTVLCLPVRAGLRPLKSPSRKP
jgi:hypothetical protein